MSHLGWTVPPRYPHTEARFGRESSAGESWLMIDIETREWKDEECLYCAGAEEVLVLLPDGSRDYIPCPERRHRPYVPATSVGND